MSKSARALSKQDLKEIRQEVYLLEVDFYFWAEQARDDDWVDYNE